MNNFDAIDLKEIKQKVIEYCAINKAKQDILDEEVVFNPLLIKSKLNDTKEAYDLLKKDFNISFDGIEDISAIFIKTSKDIALDPIELASVLTFLNHSVRIKNKLSTINEDLNIKSYGDSLYINEDLIKRIDKIVDVAGNIKDDASPKLKELNNAIIKSNNDIRSLSATFIMRHQASLQEATVFYRNNRVAFLLKNSDKNKFNGYQYGSSSSGLATYVEPYEFIELNNKIAKLEIEKEDEIVRILKEISYYIGSVSDLCLLNIETLVKLDMIFAKAEYGFYNSGNIAILNDDNSLYLKDICHPLINKENVVCNTYTLNRPYKGIVISGTNTGGKTVGLKLIGLSVLMTYLGIPLLCEKASVPFFENVYIDIDDNQSISNNLSTFSAHISNINDILNNANDKSLILIDELISGTDPKEAQAISLAILKKILDIGSYFVITTHYDDIKEFAYKNENILLSSVSFDMKKLKPTYKYIENSIGVSNAIDIASRYLDDQKIIDYARYYLDENKTKQEELLEKLGKEIHENEELKHNLKLEKKKADELNRELNAKLKAFDKEKEELKAKYLEELNEYIEDLKQKALDKLDDIKDAKKDDIVVKQIEQLKVNPKIVKEEVFEVGDRVRIGNNNAAGEIVEINGNTYSISINGMIFKTNKNKLTKLPKKVKSEYKPKQRLSRVSRELNLVGERVEDALDIMDNYLDNAYGSGLKEVKIIHGFGTGQLRKGIREHLKKNKIVKSFDNGDVYDGGGNVTIVKFI